MQRLGVLGVAILWLLIGCGGNKATVVDKSSPPPPRLEDTLTQETDSEQDEPLIADVSEQRLEELYAKSGSADLENEIKKWEAQRKFDMPIHVNKQVRNYIVYFSTERKAVFSRFLSRSSRYLPMIKKVFAEYGLPEDLAYLAMIESGFNNKAYSPAAASGMWQFIRGTGARYGLAMDNYIDERRDPEKSTRAAAEYLLDLYKRFGSWYLAAASYNCGEGRVQKEINQSTHKNFWELSDNMCLPTETKNYVPQMIAAIIISKSPQKYGFKSIPYQPPLKYDQIKVTEPTHLGAAAIASGTSVEEIQALNPELLRGTTPPHYSAYILKVPPGKKEAFQSNIAMARAQMPSERSYARRAVSDDDDDDGHEAKSSRSSRSASRSRSAKRSVRLARPKTPASSGPTNLVYRVQPGDTPAKIAKRFQTSEADLLARNNLKTSQELKKNQVLHVSTARAKGTSRTSTKSSAAEADTEPVAASILPTFTSSKSKGTSKTRRKPEAQAATKKKAKASPAEKKNSGTKAKKDKADKGGNKNKRVSAKGQRRVYSGLKKKTGKQVARPPGKLPSKKVAKSQRRSLSRHIARNPKRVLQFTENAPAAKVARP